MSGTRAVEVRGSGRAELAAYGLADAEHRVEKELDALWPGCRVEILEVARAAGGARIVEEFVVRYCLRGEVTVAAEDSARAAAEALRRVRPRFEGSRYARIALDAVVG